MKHKEHPKDKQEIDHYNEIDINSIKYLVLVAGLLVIFAFFLPMLNIESKPIKKAVLLYQGDIITYGWNDSIKYILKNKRYYSVGYHHYKSEKRWLTINGRDYNQYEYIKYFKIENQILLRVDSIIVD